jgi:hypothetical protein
MTTFSDQVYQYGGMPVGGEMTTGNVFFVSSVSGSDGNTGTKPSQPFATLDKATNACTANNNDIVYIMPNHAESIAATTTWVPDVAGVKYIGIGLGADAPELTFTATGSKISFTGGNNLISNIRFIAGISAVALGVDVVSTNHVHFDRCVFEQGTTSGYDFVWSIRFDTANYCSVKNCNFIAEAAADGASSAISIDNSDYLVISNNAFSGDFANSAIESATTEAASTAIRITDNDIYNDDTTSTYGGGIALRCAATGVIARNMVGWLSKAAEGDIAIDPGSCLMFENYVCNAIDEYGVQTLIGAASS